MYICFDITQFLFILYICPLLLFVVCLRPPMPNCEGTYVCLLFTLAVCMRVCLLCIGMGIIVSVFVLGMRA